MSDPFSGNFGVDPSVHEKDGTSLAQQAVHYDTHGQTESAIFFYNEAAQALLSASLAGSRIPGVVDKANEYIIRAESLKLANQNRTKAVASHVKSQQQLDLEKAQFLLKQAFDEDESEDKEEAVELYSQAVELCIRIRQNTSDASLQDKVKSIAKHALDRAEELKKPSKQKPVTRDVPSGSVIKTVSGAAVPPLGFDFMKDDQNTSTAKTTATRSPSGSLTANGLVSVGPAGYTKEEIDVLRRTSDINGRKYVPFMDVDKRERFAYPMSFSDRDGKLTLSPKQMSRFGKWARPDEYMDNPTMIMTISSMSIKQTIVSDCSFVASLAISAQYERRFKKKLITSAIYPQNRQGDPVINPCGKYMVKLNINGMPRKVIIDDFLPMSRDGELLCSYSNNRNELWVSLMEKAYMKVMGGYDFPGSNSNIDLHALTGWIPERVAIRLGSAEFDADREFRRLHDRFHKGHCLITLATGDMSDADADRAGLVPTHAYAMLDIREVKSLRMFMLKNPWNHLRWKGRYSENDTTHWTCEMQNALNYDPKNAQQFDNGVFWIDYDSLCHFYDVIYINWNPDLFSHTTCLHHTWSAKDGPTRDSYNMSDNPQFRLEVRTSKPGAVWIVLTRHITDKDDFATNKEFITLLVYKTGGKKVYYPYDPAPYKDGVRINSPHYLCKLVEDGKGTSHYTLVVSQYAKNNTIHYTLRAYATCEFSLTKIIDPYKPQFHKQVTGEWKGKTAGGCGNYPESHSNNPIYQISMDNNSSENHILIELLGPKEYSVGFEVISVAENVSNAAGAFKMMPSGAFRPGYCMLQLDRIAGGVYNIQPCTFRPGKEGKFFLEISSAAGFTLKKLQ